jgi:hypothetical protein
MHNPMLQVRISFLVPSRIGKTQKKSYSHLGYKSLYILCSNAFLLNRFCRVYHRLTVHGFAALFVRDQAHQNVKREHSNSQKKKEQRTTWALETGVVQVDKQALQNVKQIVTKFHHPIRQIWEQNLARTVLWTEINSRHITVDTTVKSMKKKKNLSFSWAGELKLIGGEGWMDWPSSIRLFSLCFDFCVGLPTLRLRLWHRLRLSGWAAEAEALRLS